MKLLRLGLVATFLIALSAGAAWAWGDATECVACHTTLDPVSSSGELHTAHNTFINDCGWCHPSSGDVRTSESELDPDNSCSGCHTGGGTAQHHITTGAASCGCHSSGTSWPRGTEATLPPYYGTAATSLRFSCFDGIDNDGDDLYDGGDSDCVGVPAEEKSWTVIKEYYGSE